LQTLGGNRGRCRKAVQKLHLMRFASVAIASAPFGRACSIPRAGSLLPSCLIESCAFARYNFGRVHGNLRATPAMEALLSNHGWSLDEMIGLLDNIARWRRE
jgi:hypothetical protein